MTTYSSCSNFTLYSKRVNASNHNFSSTFDYFSGDYDEWMAANAAAALTMGVFFIYVDNATGDRYEVHPNAAGVPAGYVRGTDNGQWAYSCTCPDYAANEGPYNIAIAPSHLLSRNWTRPRPEFPCKHIVAAALANGDMNAVLGWTSESLPDLPARELWAQAAANWANYERARTRYDDEQVYREQQTSIRIDQAMADRSAREQESSWELRKDLGEIWDFNEEAEYRDRFGEPTGPEWERFYKNEGDFKPSNGPNQLQPVNGLDSLFEVQPGTVAYDVAVAEQRAIAFARRKIGQAVNWTGTVKPPQPPSISAPRPSSPSPSSPSPTAGEAGWRQEMEY